MKANYMNYFKDGNCYQWNKNNDIFVITPTKLDSALEFCLDQKMMETFLKFNSPKLKLGKTLQVQEGNLKVNLKICHEVLSIPNMDFTATSRVNIEDLRMACRYIDVRKRKPICEGVFVGKNVVCATDAFHAFQRPAESSANISIPVGFISLLSGIEGEIELQSNKNNVQAKIGDSTIIGRLLDGEYPTLERVYACIENTKQIEFDVKEFLNYLDFSTEKEDYVVLTNNKFEIAGAIPFEAELKDFNLDCEMNLSVEHLKTALKDIKEEKAVFRYQGPTRPVFINEEFLILPFRKLA